MLLEKQKVGDVDIITILSNFQKLLEISNCAPLKTANGNETTFKRNEIKRNNVKWTGVLLAIRQCKEIRKEGVRAPS